MAAGSEPRSKGRTGRPWRRTRTRLIELWRRNHTPCWLCGLPIDWDLPTHLPESGSVDHLDPISHGGDPLDATRMAPAHMGCNSRRGNRTSSVRHPVSRRW